MSIPGADAIKIEAAHSANIEAAAPRQNGIPHISVCICTYKRPLPLGRLLRELNTQETGINSRIKPAKSTRF